MAVITPIPKTQFIGADGVPLVGGKVYTYAAGTTTPQVTYTDSTGSTANSNPIILDSRGEANIWLGEATYKFKLLDADNVEIWTVDYISAPTTAVSPVLTGNVTISTDSSGPALKITQTGTGDVLRVQDSVDPDITPFVINAAGLVGLGTVAPAEALDIDNDGKIQFSANGTARTIISADASNSTIDVKDNRNFLVKTNGGTRLTISGAGTATFSNQLVVSSGGASIVGNSTITGSLTTTNGLIITGGVTVTGNSAVTGTLTVSSTLTASNALVVTTGGLTVSGGGAAITGNSSVTGTFGVSSTFTASNGLTVSAGGATITGNSSITGTLGVSNALTVSAGGLTVTSGGLTVSAGGAAITGNSSVTGTLGVSSTLTASNGLTVAAGGATVTGNSSITGTLGVSSTLTASNGLTVSAGGATVTSGGLTVSAGGATITGNSSVTGTLSASSTLTASNGLTVSAGGATITGNSSVTGTLSASSTLTASNGLTVSAGGASITGNSSVTGTFGVSSTLSVTGASTLTGNLTIQSSTSERTITLGSSGGYFYGNATQIGWKDSGATAKVYWDTSGNLTAAANVTAYSDARLKKNVTTITNALELVNKMRGVYYDRIDTGEAGVGVIAQEMQAVLPQVVKENDDALSVAYGNIIGVLIEAVKELSAKLEKQ